VSVKTVPIAEVKRLVDILTDLDIEPLHLHVDGHKPTDLRPDVRLWTRTRTDYERLLDALKVKPKQRHERRYSPQGQREFYAEHDTDARRLLVQCVSLEHHDDWRPRGKGAAA
jgi:hypothetical protein